MHDSRSKDLAARDAIERELHERLARERQPDAVVTAPSAALARVGLACAACRGINPADARFCTRCGVRFNATVVPRGAHTLAACITIAAASLLLHPSVLSAAPQVAPAPQTSAPPLLSTTPMPPAGASAQPAQMSGLPLQVSDLPPGTVAVRVIRRSFAENVSGQRVDLAVGAAGRVLSGTTDAQGRAVFSGVKIGETVRARATVDGEAVASQFFELPARGGVRLVLVAGAAAGTAGHGEDASADASVPTGSDSSPASSRSAIAIGISGSLFALAAGAVGVSASRNRRRAQRIAAGPPARRKRGRPPGREAHFQALVQLERDHRDGKVGNDVYLTRRETLIDELVEIDSAS